MSRMQADGAGSAPTRASRSDFLDWLALFAQMATSAAAIGVALMLLLALAMSAGPAQASPPPEGAAAPQGRQSLPASEARGGAVVFRSAQGPVLAPLLGTSARIHATAVTARAVVTQRFRNPTDAWLEGSYVFPLPDDAAVDHYRIRIGERTIEGRIRERAQARREYDAARSAGQVASLIEQDRPNVFTTRLANIAPGARIDVEIEYQQAVVRVDGGWRLRFPTTVRPRYTPAGAAPAGGPSVGGDPNGAADVGAGPRDGDAPQPAAVDGALALDVALEPGVAITPPTSATHPVAVDRLGEDRFAVRIDGPALADRDFELEWRPLATRPLEASFQVQPGSDGAHFGLVAMSPWPVGPTPERHRAREVTFIIDRSGSMEGQSIAQARSALAFGLKRLQADDRFNVIAFSSEHRALFAAPVPASAANVAKALAFTQRLRADGGTEMAGALHAALAAPAPAEQLLPQVVFITDGAVSNEDEVVGIIEREHGRRRVFTVGISSAPNTWFMRKAAQAGQGTFTAIPDTGEVERRMAELFATLERPSLTDLAIRFEGAQPRDPVTLPQDLYAGEPVSLALRFDGPPSALVLSGRGGDGQRLEQRVSARGVTGAGLDVLWARRTVEALGDDLRRLGVVEGARDVGSDADSATGRVRQRIVAIGLAHHLVTRFTSLVAVDTTPARPADAPLNPAAVPALKPADWVDSQAADLPRGGTAANALLLAGIALLAAAAWLRRPVPARS